MKRPVHPLKYRYNFLRGRLVQPLFWVLVFFGPALDVFRVDMMAQRLVFSGKRLPFSFDTLMWLPIGFCAAVILIGIVSFMWGRLFCGWACPHDTLTEWTRPLRAMLDPGSQREEKPRWMKLLLRERPWAQNVFYGLSPMLGLLLTTALAVLLSFYVVPPGFVLAQYAGGHPHPTLVFGHLLFVLIGLFLLYAGHDFCRTCCPYGMAQSLSAYHENSRWRPMEIRFSGDKATQCKTCRACQIVCPVAIDPRSGAIPDSITGHIGLKVGQFDGCFNCGECIDACKYIQGFKNSPGLLSFRPPGFRKRNAPAASNRTLIPESCEPPVPTAYPKHLYPRE